MVDYLKGAWRSVTIWANGVILAALPVLDYAKDNIPLMADYMAADVYKGVMIAIVGLNIILRFRTNGSLADKVRQ